MYMALNIKHWGWQGKKRSTWIQIDRNYSIWRTEKKITFEKWTEPHICDAISSDNLHVIGVPKKRRENVTEKIF